MAIRAPACHAGPGFARSGTVASPQGFGRHPMRTAGSILAAVSLVAGVALLLLLLMQDAAGSDATWLAGVLIANGLVRLVLGRWR